MKDSITWKKFEELSENVHRDFEDLCRLFFKYNYVKDPNITLTKQYNNPGIENNPVLVDGKMTGFQAKYFIGNIDYEQLLESTKVIARNYNGKIDKVIYFCNKDLKENTKKFKEIINLLLSINATYELCCNESLLDLIKTEEKNSKIKSLFFGLNTYCDEWFDKTLNKSLNDLSPRYEKSGLHINVHTEGYIHSFYRDSKVIDEIKKVMQESIKKLKTFISIESEIKKEVFAIIESLEIPSRENLEDVLTWGKKFSEVNKKIDNEEKKISNKIEELQKEISKNEKKISDLNCKLDEYYCLSSLINDFDMQSNCYTKYLNEKVMLIEGDAGTGKSHLMGYIADKNNNTKDHKTILLLGQKFLFDDTPCNQICKILNIQDDFESFLMAIEAKGELEGTIFVLMIDAINECDDYRIWKNYLNDLILNIEDKKYIRLIMSIRSTYKNEFFNDNIRKRIDQKEIPCVETYGFKHNLDEALPKFFEYYKIPLSTSAFFNYELENPLFLKIYCESYDKTISSNDDNLYSMFLRYVDNYEKKIKNEKNIDQDIYFGEEIIKRIGFYFYDNNTYGIPYFNLVELCKDLVGSKYIIDGFIKSKILLKYHHNKGLILYLNYQKFSDYAVALYLNSQYEQNGDLKCFMEKIINSINKDENAPKNWLGYISALSVLKSNFFDSNFEWMVNSLKNQFIQKKFVDEYVSTFSLRSNKNIRKEDYFKYIYPHLKNDSLNRHFDILIKLSLRNCSLNSKTLSDWLNNLTLTQRDYYWTIYINEHYEQGTLLYNIVNFAFKQNMNIFDEYDLENYIFLLGQLLSSSNRELRDKSSKALTLILINRPNLIIFVLDKFLTNVDPYIVSRIMGCCYGAVLNSDENKLGNPLWPKLADLIYEKVFNVEIPYKDILFRDYALNLIEYLNFKNVKLNFDIRLCRPPYKTVKIPNINTEIIIKMYDSRKKRSGLKTIKYSLMPELSIKGFGSGYGDFGRYTFDSALKHFSGYDKETIFKYAFFYIVNDLKYDENLFSEYDINVGYGRDRRYSLKERIGKKYEWITMYHILAIVSDLYPLTKFYSDDKILKYRGTWNPYVREYDPSLLLSSMDRIYNLNLSFYWNEYKNWDFNNEGWVSNNDLNDFKKYAFLKDSNNENWISLHFTYSNRKEDRLNKYESVWMSSTALIVKVDEKERFIKKASKKHFFGRWFKPAEVGSVYTLFIKEYISSPGFYEEYNGPDFIEGIVECDTENVSVHKLSPCYINYLWEEEYDYSKKENINLFLPSRFLIKLLDLKQKEAGLWYKDNELVAVDFQLVTDSNVEGLYLKESFVNTIKKHGYDIVWIGLGEKCMGENIDFTKCKLSEISSLIWYEKENIREINRLIKGE